MTTKSLSSMFKVFEAMNDKTTEQSSAKQVLVLHAVAQLQQFCVGNDKSFHAPTVAFKDHLAKILRDYSIVHLIFDRYDVGASLKDHTRGLRMQGTCQLEIKNKTRIPTEMWISRTTKIRMPSLNSSSKQPGAILGTRLMCWWNDQVSVAIKNRVFISKLEMRS